MKIIAIPTRDGEDCVYVTREGVVIIENTDCLGCMQIICDNIACDDCQLSNKLEVVRLDELEHYIFECGTNAESEKKYKEVIDNE